VKLLLTTATGSVYAIDTAARTWRRLEAGGLSGRARTCGGGYRQVFVLSSMSLVIIADPLDPAAEYRRITTSPVIKAEPGKGDKWPSGGSGRKGNGGSPRRNARC